jgi:DNA-binding NarL/FixJ family response regulator
MTVEQENRHKTDKKRIFLVDDHPIVRQGIRMVIEQEADLAVCGEAESAHEAMSAIEESHPDLAVVDLTLRDSSGLELIKDLQIRCPELLVLVLSMRDEAFYAERVLRAGARGYITKEEGPGKVIEGIRNILGGQIHISERMSSKVIRKFVDGRSEEAATPVDRLTDRELEVFEMVGNGLPTREIAGRLHISPKTVDSHREHIKQKLKIDNATELLKQAIQWIQMQKGS